MLSITRQCTTGMCVTLRHQQMRRVESLYPSKHPLVFFKLKLRCDINKCEGLNPSVLLSILFFPSTSRYCGAIQQQDILRGGPGQKRPTSNALWFSKTFKEGRFWAKTHKCCMERSTVLCHCSTFSTWWHTSQPSTSLKSALHAYEHSLHTYNNEVEMLPCICLSL